jgi:Flp pilus assembly protein TadD
LSLNSTIRGSRTANRGSWRAARIPGWLRLVFCFWIGLNPTSWKNVQAAEPAIAYSRLSDEAAQALNEGLNLFRNSKFSDAKEAFKRVTILAPTHPVGWINLGSIEFRAEELDLAAEHLKIAVGLDPSAQQAWLTLGIIAYKKNDLDWGLAALSQAVYLNPKDAKAHLYLGVLIRKKGWLSGAEEEMRKAIELDESYAEAHYNLAVLCLERQPPAFELARRHYFEALKLGAQPDPELDKTFKER